MKKINQKLWQLFFTHIMGVEFIADSPNFRVKTPIGIAMCEQEVEMGAMQKIKLGLYSFNK